jgi:hypothetical protein
MRPCRNRSNSAGRYAMDLQGIRMVIQFFHSPPESPVPAAHQVRLRKSHPLRISTAEIGGVIRFPPRISLRDIRMPPNVPDAS